MEIDAAAALLALLCLCAAIAGRAAPKLLRSPLRWAALALLTGPIALAALVLMPKLEPCASCGRPMRISSGAICRRCGWRAPITPDRAKMVALMRREIGPALGDSLARAERELALRGADATIVSQDLATARGRSFGRDAEIEVSLSGGRVVRAAARCEDDGFALFRELTASLISEHGRPERRPGREIWRADGASLELRAVEDGSHGRTEVEFVRERL